MELLEKHFATAFNSPNGIKELRSLILKLAMMGKLVPQDPSDQPASELLKEIQAEKERLIADGKIKKQKPLPAIKPEEITYELPNSWVWCRLGDVSLYSEAGKSFKCQNIPISDDEWGVIKVSAISWGKFNEDENKFYSKSEPENTDARITKGDFIISRANTSELVGKSVVVGDIKKKLLLSDKTIRFQFTESISVVFLNFYNNSSNSRAYYSSVGSGTSSSMKNITRAQMNSLILSLPPLNEQKRIVTKINELMSRCDEMERLKKEQEEKRLQVNTSALHQLLESPDKDSFQNSFNFITRNFSHIYSVKENVEKLKKAMLQLAMMGKLVSQDPNDQPASELLKEIQTEKEKLIAEGKIKKQKDLPAIKTEEIPYELPEGWEWTKIGYVCDLKTGATPSRSNKSYFGGDIKWLVSGDIHRKEIYDCEGRITEKGMNGSNCKILPIDSVMIALNGQGKTRATVAILKTAAACNQSLVAIIPHTKRKELSTFIFWNLHSRYYSLRDITGQDKRRGLNMKLIDSLLIPLPPIAEQYRIVSKINEIMDYCDGMIEKIDRSELIRDKLLHSVLANV